MAIDDVIGIGVDLVEVDRMRQAIGRTPTMVERLFTPGERAYAAEARDPAERLAARFAAKEAVMKALGVGLGAFEWHDVEVLRAESGQPSLRISGRAAGLAAAAGVQSWRISLTHSGTMAEAVVVAL